MTVADELLVAWSSSAAPLPLHFACGHLVDAEEGDAQPHHGEGHDASIEEHVSGAPQEHRATSMTCRLGES